MAVDTAELTAAPGDRLLLCTDGLSSLVPDEELADILQRHDAPEDAVKALNEMAKDFRRELSKIMRMRRVPELRFKYDDSVDRGERIDALLRGDRKG